MLLALLLLWAGEWLQGEGHWERGGAAPPLPRGCSAQDLRYKLEVPESVTVEEGSCVLVSCAYSHPYTYWTDSVSGYWFREGANTNHDSPVATNNPKRQVQEETRGRFHLLLDPQTRNCSLHITDARRGDNGSYFFRVESGSIEWNYCAKQVSVKVEALTHTPHILVPGTLEPGRPSNLTCSVPWACEQGTPPTFSWMSAALASLGPRTTRSSVLSLSPRLRDHGTKLTCQVMFPGVGVTVERTIQLNVTGNHRTKVTAGVVQGAIGGAGVTALLAGCLCATFFIVKTLRRKAAKTVGDMKGTEPATGPAPLDLHQESKPHGPADPLGPSREEQELHYASLSFHPQKKPSTQYSQVTIH